MKAQATLIDLHDTDAKLAQPVLPKMPGSWKTEVLAMS